MGTVMQRMVQLGEYCDCLQNWSKYVQSDEEISSNLQISENLSNIEVPLEMAFQPQRVDNILDEQLKVMHEKQDKRKKLKAEYIKQRQKQRINKQRQEQRIMGKKLQNIQNLKREKQLLTREEELRRRRQLEVQKVRRLNEEKKIRGNKRNNRHRKIQQGNTKLNNLIVTVPIMQLSTTDENIAQFNQNSSLNQEKLQQQNFHEVNEEEQQQQSQQQFQQQQQEQEQQQRQQKQQSHKQQKEDKKYNQTPQQKNEVIDQHVDEIKSEDLDSYLDTLATHKEKRKDKGLEIIDLSKLDPASIKDQISQLVLKKLNLNQKLTSQTVPLHPKQAQSHRVVGNKMTQVFIKKGHLYYEDRQEYRFEEDEIQFGESQLTRQNTENYFLDDKDKQEYLRIKKH